MVSTGFVCLCVFGAVDLLRFDVQKYVTHNNDWLPFSLIPIGALIFIVLTLLNYMLSIYHVQVEQTEKKILAKLAYTDELCQIYNRTKFREVYKSVENSGEEFALVDFDLNGLKTINDTFGHASGDLLIKEFADVLCDTFRDIGEAFRVGGDEFLVLIWKDGIGKVEDALIKLRDNEKIHSEKINIIIHSSYGVAYSSEVPQGEANKVYSLADKRMYEMKNQYHSTHGTGR